MKNSKTISTPFLKLKIMREASKLHQPRWVARVTTQKNEVVEFAAKTLAGLIALLLNEIHQQEVNAA